MPRRDGGVGGAGSLRSVRIDDLGWPWWPWWPWFHNCTTTLVSRAFIFELFEGIRSKWVMNKMQNHGHQGHQGQCKIAGQ